MSDIDPVEFGKLVNAVETLDRTVKILQCQVSELTSIAEKGRGAWWAAMALAGAFGASIHSIREFLR